MRHSIGEEHAGEGVCMGRATHSFGDGVIIADGFGGGDNRVRPDCEENEFATAFFNASEVGFAGV